MMVQCIFYAIEKITFTFLFCFFFTVFVFFTTSTKCIYYSDVIQVTLIIRLVFPALTTGLTFSRAHRPLIVFLRLALVKTFPCLARVKNFPALATCSMFSRACQPLNVFPRSLPVSYFSPHLSPVACILALAICEPFSRVYYPLTVFPRL